MNFRLSLLFSKVIARFESSYAYLTGRIDCLKFNFKSRIDFFRSYFSWKRFTLAISFCFLSRNPMNYFQATNVFSNLSALFLFWIRLIDSENLEFILQVYHNRSTAVNSAAYFIIRAYFLVSQRLFRTANALDSGLFYYVFLFLKALICWVVYVANEK